MVKLRKGDEMKEKKSDNGSTKAFVDSWLMCGILLQAQRHPCVHSKYFNNVINQDGYYRWETDDVNYIRSTFLTPDFEDVSLTKSDEMKLANIDRIRELNEEMGKLRNNVKMNESVQRRREEIEDKIKILTAVPAEGLSITAQLSTNDIFQSLIPAVATRGPDFLGYAGWEQCGWQIEAFSSVLSLRQPFTKQPVRVDDELVVQFNGELYNEDSLQGNDTEYVRALLLRNIQGCPSRTQAIMDTFCQLDGEFAFCIIDRQDSKIYFGRDVVGKRSLTFSLHGGIIISSVASPTLGDFSECDNSICVYDLKDESLSKHKYSDVQTKVSRGKFLNFDLIQPSHNACGIEGKIEALHAVLKRACYLRQSTIYSLNSKDLELGILFSGGLDCSILAAIICENALVSENKYGVDLLTVGFENPRTNQTAEASPDRKLSKKSWFFLSQKYNTAGFKLGLVEVDVCYKEWLMNKRRVQRLMYPSETEMDLSIAIAFYFASRFKGRRLVLKEIASGISFEEYILNESQYAEMEEKYASDRKVLFSGLGADELFAGYSRHEALFNDITNEASLETVDVAYEQLSKSLMHDIEVIHHRNLGRDDRVISCWGKELRYPYLDESVIDFAMNDLEPNLKFAYTFEVVRSKKHKEGKHTMIGERKFLLRRLAQRLGLDWVKSEPKRAIQFGAKSAKLEIGQNKAKGTDAL